MHFIGKQNKIHFVSKQTRYHFSNKGAIIKIKVNNI